MDNYDDVIEQLSAAGLEVGRRIEDVGRLVRCRTDDDRPGAKSGWYWLHEYQARSGARLLVGAYGSWKESGADGRPVSRRIELRKQPLEADEKTAIRERIAEDKRRSEARRVALARRAATRAEQAWRACAPTGENGYLDRKGVQGHGVRFSARGNLVVPVADAMGRIHGLQVIYADAARKRKIGRDKDFWPAGLAKRGHFHLIGTPTVLVLVAEGYATAASLHEATGFPLAVAFDAGNLMPVSKALRRRYRDARVLFCADDDWLQRCRACGKQTPVADETCKHCGEVHGKSNPGISAATTAALSVDGAVVFPVFADRGERKLTDYNDLHQEEGLHVVRVQIEEKIEALGWQIGGLARAHHTTGERGREDFHFDIAVLLQDYALIYSTETCFDRVRRTVVGLSSLRAAAGKALVRAWLEHPERKTVLPDQVVFDPGGNNGVGTCNLWGGWPTVPQAGSCTILLELLEYLCSNDENPRELYNWVLCWLAYPLQNPGAKMQTALLIHGSEGSGKNMFFGAVRDIYAQYGCLITQSELESQFNGWASGKLFIVGNEVVTRVELYHHQGRLKNMVSEPEWPINEKNLPVRSEANHANFVFFSNRLDIAKLDRDDRRYCVIWTPPAVAQEFYSECRAEMDAGGIAALHNHLLNMDIGNFAPWTKPPMTRAKRELIDLGMDSTERFWRDWTSGDLPVPCCTCKTTDLYRAYRHWAGMIGVPRPAPEYVLIGAATKKVGVVKQRRRFFAYRGQSDVRVQAMVLMPPDDRPPEGEDETTWLSGQVDRFANAMDVWKDGAGFDRDVSANAA